MDQKRNQYDEILCDNMLKEFFHFKSPHVILSKRKFNDVKMNVIMLTQPKIEGMSKNRQIFYNIKYIFR